MNIANLLQLLFYCTGYTGWLITYQWLAGDAVCRVANFLWMLSFYLSSFVTASIAAGRLHAVCKMKNVWSKSAKTGNLQFGKECMKPVKGMLLLSWLISIVCSVPQLAVWAELKVQEDWHQCTTVFQTWRSYSEPFAKLEAVYLMFHLLSVFWVPFAIITVSYALLIVKLFNYSPDLLKKSSTGQPSILASHLDYQGEESVQLATFSPIRKAPEKNPTNSLDPKAYENEISANYESGVSTSTNLLQPAANQHRSSRFKRSNQCWRYQMKTRMFKIASVIVLAYILCWGPYNVLSLIIYAQSNEQKAASWSDNANWLKVLIPFNTVLNPFLYGSLKWKRRWKLCME